MSDREAKLVRAAKLFSEIENQGLGDRSIVEIAEIELSLRYAEAQLGRANFGNENEIALFFPDANGNDRNPDQLYGRLFSAIEKTWHSSFKTQAHSINELRKKFEIWRRAIPDDYSKSVNGFADEYIAWSIFKDVKRLASINNDCSRLSGLAR